MRINFRQGIVSYQTSSNVQDFLSKNPSGNVDLKADNRPTTVSVAHANTNYTFTDNYTVTDAWIGPFSTLIDYWLYWNFDPLTFERTFGYTTVEPVAQDAEPGNGDSEIIDIIPGATAGVGAFVVEGHYVLQEDRPFAVVGSTDTDGTYTVKQATYNALLGQTQIAVNEIVETPTDTVYGQATLDIDSYGVPLRTSGRHWYNTETNRHYMLSGDTWIEVIRVFAAHLRNGLQFLPQSINTGDFSGTQIGDTSSVLTGRVVYTEGSDPIRREDGTFFTTEDQFFANAARVDAIRLESNVARAQFAGPGTTISEFSVVAWEPDPSPADGGRIRVAEYDDAGTTVVGILTESLTLNQVGAVVIQGVITYSGWNWTTGSSAVLVGSPLWIENGQLVPYDPHVQGNRAGTIIVDVLNGSTDQYFEVASAYTLDKGQTISITGNSTNNDGVYKVVSSEYISVSNTTKIYVSEIIIDAVTGGQMLMTIGNYPVGQVPVARVLDNDTVVFEQGLGGKGDQGPAGSIEDIPSASAVDLGGVYLNLPPVSSDIPLAVGDNDSRLSDSRSPLAHTHSALEVNTTPGFGISSLNVQGALDEIGAEKLDNGGGTMTGFLTLNDNPSNALHAVPKQYVDALVSGLVWLDPICVVNMISDIVDAPPASPILGDAYIVTATAIGGWALIPAGNVVTWNGTTWTDRGALTDLNPAGSRLGVAMQSTTVPSGMFAGQKNNIAQMTPTGTLDSFEIPTSNDAVYACSGSEVFKYNQYAFSGTDWVLFGGSQAVSADGATITQSGNVISVIQHDDGGIIDSTYWQNLVPSDLDLLYAPVSHYHSSSQILFVLPYISPVPGLGGISSPNVEAALQEIYDEKASLTPTYPTIGDLPDPTTYSGMVTYVVDETEHYIAQSGTWVKVPTYPMTIPYDMSFFQAGNMLVGDAVINSILATREITLPANLTNSIARAKVAPSVAVTYDINLDTGSSIANIGSLLFDAGNRVGVFTFPSTVVVMPGVALEIVTPPATEPNIKDVSITIVGCSAVDECQTATPPPPLVLTVNDDTEVNPFTQTTGGPAIAGLVNASGGSGPYTYAFELLSSTGGWIQWNESSSSGPWSSDDPFNSNTNAPYVHESQGNGTGQTYNIQVTVQDTVGTTAVDTATWTFFSF